MKVYEEISLIDFDFWSGAKDNVSYLTHEDLEHLEPLIEDMYCDNNGMIDCVDLNDLFRFEEDWIAELLGYEDFEALRRDRIRNSN